MSGTRATLRIARRDATRAKGRSALVVTMIGLPVMAITALAVLLRTLDTTPVDELPWSLGTADAKVVAHGRADVVQDPYLHRMWSEGAGSGSGPNRPWRSGEVAEALGPGTRLVPVTTGEASFRTQHGYARAVVKEIDVRDPLTDGLLRLGDGRAPRTLREVMVSPSIAARGFDVGSTLRVTRQDTPMRVVGIATNPYGPRDDLIVTLPEAGVLGTDVVRRSWLADTAAPVTWEDVRRLNHSGLAVLSRAVVHDPPPPSKVPEDVRDGGIYYDAALFAVVGLIVTMILLEVVLLAGPAFAVGLRRQRRQLGLVAVAGGGARHLRAVVLGGGLVLGTVAAVAGGLAGMGFAAAAAQVLRSFTLVGPYEVPWLQVAAVAAVGIGSGLLAALVPAAQAARMDVVAALGDRRGQVRTRRGWPAVGLVVVGLGVAATVASVIVAGELGVAAGAVLIQLGLVAASPWIVGLAGRYAGRFPMPLRLAARDAARNRGRTAPAVAAIIATTAGLTALAIGGASDVAERRAEYIPRAPMGTAILSMTGYDMAPKPVDPQARAALRRVLERELPGVPVLRLREPALSDSCRYRDEDCRQVIVRPPCEPGGCRSMYATNGGGLNTVVGGERALRFLLGHNDPAAAKALANGKAIVFNPAAVDGTLTMEILRFRGGAESEVRGVQVPAIARDADLPVKALVPPSAVERLGADVITTSYVIAPEHHRVTPEEEQRIQEAAAAVLERAELYVERGFTDPFMRTILLILAAVATVMVLGGTLIATGLAAADSRPDLATLAAVGAAPRTRRLLTMGQAAVVAVLGVGLGLVAGAVPGIAITWPLTTNPDALPVASGGIPQVPGPVIDIPWLPLAGMAVALPLLAVLVAAVFTRSRLPMMRRLER